MIRLLNLQLSNFRCFAEASVPFNDKITVLVADNGHGKTAVSDAIAIVLAQFIDELTKVKQSSGIAESDVRRASDHSAVPITPTKLVATVDAGGTSLTWTTERKRIDQTPRQSPKNVAGLLSFLNNIRDPNLLEKSLLPDQMLPVVAYYRSNRFSLNSYFAEAERRKIKPLDGRFAGYTTYLEPLSTSLHFNKWYREMVAAVKSHVVTGAVRTDSSLQLLTAVNVAVDHVLGPTGWHHIDWDESRQTLIAHHDKFGLMPIGFLSAGIRTMLALTADLAHRCAILNPGLGNDAAALTPGIVLIDEVELHLHPAWQQLVVELLQHTFQSIQFILTTHSPQVLSTVTSNSIRVLKLHDGIGVVETPPFQTRGVESANVLSAIMGVDPVPLVPEAQWLSDYRAMIEQNRHEEAEAEKLRQLLVAHFGEQHPLMLDCDRLIRFTRFKAKRAAAGATDAQT
jgi:predicted ATP-binding protein involved in virulence